MAQKTVAKHKLLYMHIWNVIRIITKQQGINRNQRTTQLLKMWNENTKSRTRLKKISTIPRVK